MAMLQAANGTIPSRCDLTMATKDITDLQVCEAFAQMRSRREAGELGVYVDDILHQQTGEHMKVCFRAMERACSRGLVEYGVSLRGGWLTDGGNALIESAKHK